MNASTLIEKRLAAYALAGGAALALPGVAKADLIYSGPLNQTFAGGGTYQIARPGAGSADFNIGSIFTGSPFQMSGVSIAPAPGNSVAGTSSNAAALQLNDVIDDFSTGWLPSGSPGNLRQYKYISPGPGSYDGDWQDGQERFAGLQFSLGDGAHFGWARVSVNVTPSSAQFTLFDWAYESQPGIGITAGEVPDQVPEPSSLALFALGAAGLLAWRRSRKGRAAQ